jgi:hypothetical protein
VRSKEEERGEPQNYLMGEAQGMDIMQDGGDMTKRGKERDH